MKILLVEDEAPAARRLQSLLGKILPEATLIGPADTSATALSLIAQQNPDLLLCDIELADGLSFKIWEEQNPACPVIFITAYDHYAVRAFRVNSLDYLLKPVKEEDLRASLQRYDALSKPGIQNEMMQALLEAVRSKEPQYRQRILSTQGRELVSVPVEEIAHFYAEDRLTFAAHKSGKSLLVSESVSRLAEELNPKDWFQINRGQLVHIESVVKASPYLNHRLKLSLKPVIAGQSDVVARERVSEFKSWMGG